MDDKIINDFLQTNGPEIESKLRSFKETNFQSIQHYNKYFGEALEFMISYREDRDQIADAFLRCKEDLFLSEFSLLLWCIYEATKDKYLNYYIFKNIEYYNNELMSLNKQGIGNSKIIYHSIDFDKPEAELIHGLNKCITLKDKRSFLLRQKENFKDQIRNLKADKRVPIFFAHINSDDTIPLRVNSVKEYKYLIKLCNSELKEIDQEQERENVIKNKNGHSSFIYYPLINSLVEILVNKDVITKNQDEILFRIDKKGIKRLRQLFENGKVDGKPFIIDLTPTELSHSLYQFAKFNLIECGQKGLAFWISKWFLMKNRKGEFQDYKEETIKKYINDRKHSRKGQELFHVVKNTNQHEGAPKYLLSKTHSS